MKEYRAAAWNGFAGVVGIAVLVGGGAVALAYDQIAIGIALIVIATVLTSSVIVVQPNQAMAITFFGRYLGTVRSSGMHLVVPLTNRTKVSLRVRNFNSVKLKVNDVEGNPIEIAAVIVFRVVDSAKALFDVDKYEQFVEIQSESALRHVASQYPYDNFGGEAHSLRGNAEEVASVLTRELQERLSVAGVEVMEARLTHLAYAPEIAGAMLQRQQAAAIVSARHIIVEGAVGMAQAVIERLEREGFQLDEERKAAMMNNLMIAIVSDRSAQPILNAGTLY